MLTDCAILIGLGFSCMGDEHVKMYAGGAIFKLYRSASTKDD